MASMKRFLTNNELSTDPSQSMEKRFENPATNPLEIQAKMLILINKDQSNTFRNAAQQYFNSTLPRLALPLLEALFQDKNKRERIFCLAVRYNFGELVKAMLPLVDAVTLFSQMHSSIILYAVQQKLEAVLNVLVAEKGLASQNLQMPFAYAARHGYLEITQLLLKDQRVNPANPTNTILFTAVRDGCLPIIRLLLNDPRVLNMLESGMRSHSGKIGQAVMNGKTEGVEMLTFLPNSFIFAHTLVESLRTQAQFIQKQDACFKTAIEKLQSMADTLEIKINEKKALFFSQKCLQFFGHMDESYRRQLKEVEDSADLTVDIRKHVQQRLIGLSFFSPVEMQHALSAEDPLNCYHLSTGLI